MFLGGGDVALNLTVALSDQEQSIVEAVARDALGDTATNADLKRWAERAAKRSLRVEVLGRWRELKTRERDELIVAAIEGAETGFPKV